MWKWQRNPITQAGMSVSRSRIRRRPNRLVQLLLRRGDDLTVRKISAGVGRRRVTEVLVSHAAESSESSYHQGSDGSSCQDRRQPYGRPHPGTSRGKHSVSRRSLKPCIPPCTGSGGPLAARASCGHGDGARVILRHSSASLRPNPGWASP